MSREIYQLVLATYSLQGEEAAVLVETTYENFPAAKSGVMSYYHSLMPRPYPQAAASASGDCYWTRADEYQVLAFAADGSERWALRVAWTPGPLPRQQKEALIEAVQQINADLTEPDMIWPDRHPAIYRLLVDGHGHLYVYPYVYTPRAGTPAETPDVPVDVYSPEGERLFAGLISARYWRHAEGEFVYATGLDPITEETRVYRYRLVEPF